MLADSVESATRALQDASPERVEELVRTVVDGKIRDGQLSESPLTLREVSLIQEQFVKVIGGMFHHRLDYPATALTSRRGLGRREATVGERGLGFLPGPPDPTDGKLKSPGIEVFVNDVGSWSVPEASSG